MLIAARRIKLASEEAEDAAIDSKVMLIPAGEGALKLGVQLPSIDDPERAADRVRVAHGICPYSKATRGSVDVALTVNGRALESEAEMTA